MKQSCAIFLMTQNESSCHFIDEGLLGIPMIAIEHKRAGSNNDPVLLRMIWTVARIKCPPRALRRTTLFTSFAVVQLLEEFSF